MVTQAAEYVSHHATAASFAAQHEEIVAVDGAQEPVKPGILETNTSKQETQLHDAGVSHRTDEAQPAKTGEPLKSQAAEVDEETMKDIVDPDPLLAHDDTELQALSTVQESSVPDVVAI